MNVVYKKNPVHCGAGSNLNENILNYEKLVMNGTIFSFIQYRRSYLPYLHDVPLQMQWS